MADGRVRRLARSPLLLALVVTLGYWAILPHRLDALRPLATPVPAPTGDEPYYLEMALSLLRYGSLELTRAREIDHLAREFYPEPLLGHQAASPRGHVSKHYPGLAVVIAPFYWLGDWLSGGSYGAGRFAVTLLLGAIGGMVAAQLALLARELGASRRWALLLALVLAATSPLLSYSFLIFPELPAALLVVYAFRRGRLANTPTQTLLGGAAVAFLPWLHPRFIPLALSLAGWWLVGRRRTGREGALLLILPTLSAVGLVLYDLWAFGSPLPNTGDHAGFGGLEHLVVGAAGLLLDQQWGLLVYNPFLFFAAAGLPVLLTCRRRELVGLALVVGPYGLLIASYLQWWGEWGPPGRYLTPVLPLVVVPLAAAQPHRLAQWLLAGVLALPSLAIGVAFVLWPRTMYNHPTGVGELWEQLAHLGGPFLAPYLPSFVAPGEQGGVLLALWVVLAGVLAAVLALSTPVQTAAGSSSAIPNRRKGTSA
ncbi:MAG: hypothetical protein K6U89_06975 [Chloroflexi bacterium]|nr:hypothetical protein [Chloroflexota bacterium]